MNNWMKLSETSCIKDFYDQNDRLCAILIHNGIAVLIQCNIEGHFLITDDFLKSGNDVSFILAASIERGMTQFSSLAEEMFDVTVLEEINKKCYI